MWETGQPVFSEEIDTAGLQFDKKGNFIQFLFNPKFYSTLTFYDLKFLVCHEILHLLLRHGKRFAGGRIKKKLLNKAMDVVVNHSLVRDFEFERRKLSEFLSKNGSWIDTVFGPDIEIEEERTVEYYYGEILKRITVICLGGDIFDDHEFLEELEKAGGQALNGQDIEEILDAAGASEEEKEKLKKSLKGAGGEGCTGWGSGAGNQEIEVAAQYNPTKKWESIIQEWEQKIIDRSRFGEASDWTARPRRLWLATQEFFLPNYMDEEETWNEKGLPDKVQVLFFMDASGSCVNEADRFFNAALSLDPEVFEVSLYSFDVCVHEIDPNERKLLGGGGTCFQCIVNQVEMLLKTWTSEQHPYVFVLTDGYAGTPCPSDWYLTQWPKHPAFWNWFITEDGSPNNVLPCSKVNYLANYM